MNPFKTKDFLKLQKEWEQKLQDAKFDDINNTKDLLSNCVKDRSKRRKERLQKEATTSSYIDRLAEYLRSEAKISPRDRTILTLHCDGVPQSGPNSIVLYGGWSRTTVYYVIKHHRRLFIK